MYEYAVRPMSTERMDLKGVAAVRLQRSRRARRLRICVLGPDTVRVVVPPRESLSRAKAFVESKKEWIARQLALLQETTLLDPDTILNPKKAESALLIRLETLSRRFGLPYSKAVIRSQKTRWASCSGKNTISLNIRLFLLPRRLADYVMLHELVHTRIKAHSPAFWNTVEGFMEDAKYQDRELRRFRLT